MFQLSFLTEEPQDMVETLLSVTIGLIDKHADKIDAQDVHNKLEVISTLLKTHESKQNA